KSDATDIHIADARTSPAIVSHDTSIRRLIKRSTDVRVTNEMPSSSSSTIAPDTTAKSEINTAGETSTYENNVRDGSTAPYADNALLIS
ncbi:hypothetical protein ACJMK2_020295, partial [Sinanodonta woodiana]